MSSDSNPGWHPDPAGSEQERYWDGSAWTERLRTPAADAKTTEWPAPGTDWPPPGEDEPVGTKDAPAKEPSEPRVPVGTRLRQHRKLLTGAAIVLALGLLAGSFFIGQSTRKSDTVVNAEKAAAVQAAVDRTRAAERKVRLKAVDSAIEKTQKRNRTVIRRVVRKLKRSGDKKAAASFAAGSSSGYSSGYSSGEQDGLTRATDEVTCSDDRDITWLPYCY